MKRRGEREGESGEKRKVNGVEQEREKEGEGE